MVLTLSCRANAIGGVTTTPGSCGRFGTNHHPRCSTGGSGGGGGGKCYESNDHLHKHSADECSSRRSQYNVAARASSNLSVRFSTTTASTCTVTNALFGEPAYVSFIAAGTCTVTATQSGSSTYASASANQSFIISKGPQTVGFTSAVPISAAVGSNATYSVIATASPSGQAATISVSSTSTSICSISGSPGAYSVSYIGAGTCKLNADKASDSKFILLLLKCTSRSSSVRNSDGFVYFRPWSPSVRRFSLYPFCFIDFRARSNVFLDDNFDLCRWIWSGDIFKRWNMHDQRRGSNGVFKLEFWVCYSEFQRWKGPTIHLLQLCCSNFGESEWLPVHSKRVVHVWVIRHVIIRNDVCVHRGGRDGVICWFWIVHPLSKPSWKSEH